MSDTGAILAQLRDVNLPPAPQDVASGLILLNLALLALVLFACVRRRRRRREQWRSEALHIVHLAANLPPEKARLRLARLLRQLMLIEHDPESVDGDAWLAQLDQAFSTQWFTSGPGREFGDALYRPTTLDSAQVHALCQQLSSLIRALPAPAKKRETR